MTRKALMLRGAVVALASLAVLLLPDRVALASQVSATCAYQDPDRGDGHYALDVDAVTVLRSESGAITFTVGLIENRAPTKPWTEIRIDADTNLETGDLNGAEIRLVHPPNERDARARSESVKDTVIFRVGPDELAAAFAFQVAAGEGSPENQDDGVDVAPTEDSASMFVIKAPDQWGFPNCGVVDAYTVGKAWDQLKEDLGDNYGYVLGVVLLAVVGAAIAVAGWLIDRSRKEGRQE